MMRVLKPTTNEEWVFTIVDGPSLEEVVCGPTIRPLSFTIRQYTTGERGPRFKSGLFEWDEDFRHIYYPGHGGGLQGSPIFRQKVIEVGIARMQIVSDQAVKFIGYCPEINIIEFPFTFRAIYIVGEYEPKHPLRPQRYGKITFSFKHGHWVEIDNSGHGGDIFYRQGVILSKRRKKIMVVWE